MEIDYNIKTLEARKKHAQKIIDENWDSIIRYFQNVHLAQSDIIPYNMLLTKLANYLIYYDHDMGYRQRTQLEFENQTQDIQQYKFGSRHSAYDEDIMAKDTDLAIFESRHLLNFDFFNWENWKDILKLLRFQNEVSEKVNRIARIFNECYKECLFTETEEQIIRIFQKKQSKRAKKEFIIIKNVHISKKLGLNQVYVGRHIESICKKLSKAYGQLFIDYYYTFLVQGHYKKCLKCGEVKLVHEFYEGKNTCKDCIKNSYKICSKCGQRLNKIMFSKHPKTKDGLQSVCKLCDLERKRGKVKEN